MKLVCVLAICAVFLGLVSTERSKRQLGATGLIEKYPFIVAITYNGNFVGNGVIVSGWWILSTATAFANPTPADAYRVYAGSADYMSGSSENVIQLIIKHPQYIAPSPGNNIAMARVATIFEESKLLQSVNLGVNDVPSAATTMATFGGRQNMLEVPNRLASDEACIGTLTDEANKQIVRDGLAYCVTIESAYAVGPGDVGAPIMSMNFLYGLYADGLVATRIAIHRQWIQSTMVSNK
ncbi:serine protease 56-like [Anopheles stephensi]|uniref:serine protease 56-like n=1 Tax=Anopheles stephensi TaxID=30069 RepID=UPI001658939F|nr:serine protease 56-like [Anopheles stephensi]